MNIRIKGISMVNKVLRYFDIVSDHRPISAAAQAAGEKGLKVLPQWIAVFLGIVTQPYLSHFIQTRQFDLAAFLSSLISGSLIGSLLVAVLIFPGVYKNSFDPKSPLIVQFGTIFAMGAGYQSLLPTGL